MAAVSYQLSLAQTATGYGLEAITVGVAAPTGGIGFVEIRMDQTNTAITDATVVGATRALKKGEIRNIINYLRQYLDRDTSILQ